MNLQQILNEKRKLLKSQNQPKRLISQNLYQGTNPKSFVYVNQLYNTTTKQAYYNKMLKNHKLKPFEDDQGSIDQFPPSSEMIKQPKSRAEMAR